MSRGKTKSHRAGLRNHTGGTYKKGRIKYMTTYALNQEFNGIEISFDGKPIASILEALKENGFRWHRVKKLWYAKQTPERLELAQTITEGKEVSRKSAKTEKKNAYGVKVGDIFSASWGYEQTTTDFFQVVALVGEKSVRVRQVNLPMISSDPVCGMAEDRIYKVVHEILPPASSSVFIKDQEKGDLKRIKPGYYQDPEKAKECCFFNLSSFADAQKCTGDTVKTYESWYY